MNYFYSLPSTLKAHIYSFDPTYHEIFKKIPIEFLLKTTLWRVKWLNERMDYGNMIEQNKYNITDFNSTRKGIEFIVDYWNTTYPDYYRQLEEPDNCEGEYINDNYEGNIHIMGLLKNLKGWTIREEKKLKGNKGSSRTLIQEMVLYKPGTTNFRVMKGHFWSSRKEREVLQK